VFAGANLQHTLGADTFYRKSLSPAAAITEAVNADCRATWTRYAILDAYADSGYSLKEIGALQIQIALLPGESRCETATIGKKQDLIIGAIPTFLRWPVPGMPEYPHTIQLNGGSG
jgi:hypothetical protein